MSKAYFKKSHLHKPLKGKGSHDRTKEDAYDDLVAEYDLASNQSVHRALTKHREQTNGEPEN